MNKQMCSQKNLGMQKGGSPEGTTFLGFVKLENYFSTDLVK
jgi:hypothetical protein